MLEVKNCIRCLCNFPEFSPKCGWKSHCSSVLWWFGDSCVLSVNASGCTMVKCMLNFMPFYTDQQRNSKLVKSLRKNGLAANVYPLM